MRYARVDNAAVVEITDLPDDLSPAEAFHPSVAETMVQCGADVEEGWTYNGYEFAASDPSQIDLETLKATSKVMVDVKASQKLDVGCPTNSGYHIALDGDTRADLGAMATTAVLAKSGAVPWPESYSKGWITIENVRIVLLSPDDGIALAASVGDYYAQIRQHARDLKDAILAAEDATAIRAIDIEAGWPEIVDT